MKSVEALGGLLVISPHLDDGVFGCGELLGAHSDAVMATVFAGIPRDMAHTPGWDAACGFASAREAMIARRAEDRAALELFGATPHWLNFYDSQYGRPPNLGDVTVVLHDIIRADRAQTVVIPLGLFHSDHALAHRAALKLLRQFPERTWLAYEDAIYRRVPWLLQQRLRELNDNEVAATPARCRTGDVDRKRCAVACYASQLRGLTMPGRLDHEDIFEPERYWRLTPKERHYS